MSSPTRQLAAIMFTDILGYTSMMGKDEKGTLALVKQNREIHKKCVQRYRGKWLKEMGDGNLISFSSVSNAVKCAGRIMELITPIHNLELRIGIHLGEVVIEKGDVLGDGVNIASRIESLTPPGKIWISDAVYKNIRNQEEFQTHFVQEETLKNVEGPVKIYAVSVTESGSEDRTNHATSFLSKQGVIAVAAIVLLVTVAFVWNPFDLQRKVKSPIEEKSIAVLPFTDMSASKDQEYLGDGIAEEILNLLVKSPGLKVIGRTSSFSYRNQNKDLRTIGSELGVNTILEGSIRKNISEIRVTAQLINASDGSHIWSETYDRELQDIFEIQDEIASEIVEKFKLTMSLSEERVPPTSNIDAYELYLRGRNEYLKGVDGVQLATQYLEKAKSLDPSFLETYALLAESYWAIGFYGLEDAQVNYRLAKKNALHAIDIYPDHYIGYAKLSWLNFMIDWNWEASFSNNNKALARGMIMDTNYPSIHAALYGKTQESIDMIKILLKEDPLDIELLLHLSRSYGWADQFENVIENGEKIIQLQPENSSIKRHLGQAYLFMGNYELALRYYRELVMKDSTYAPQGYVGALVGLGRENEAREFLSAISSTVSPGKKAMSLIHLKEFDSAFKYLEIAFDQKDNFLPFIQIEPHFDSIRNDPRYNELLVRMGLDKYK